MQIIQTIRDKGAALVIAIIALSLIGFILMDAKQGAGRMFGTNSSSLGKVDGTTIEREAFDKKVKETEAQQQQQGQKPNIYQIRDGVWNQLTSEKIFNNEANKLGIDFTAKELSAILSSNDQSNPLLQDKQMIDPVTGKLDQSKLIQALANIKKMKGDQYDNVVAQIEEPQKIASLVSKYTGLLNASAYLPAWMEDKDNKDASAFANISYVSIPYNVISDSVVKVSDADIDAYVSKNKDLFKQEAGRTISYVSFSQNPSAADSAAIKEQVLALKNNFINYNNAAAFVVKNASRIEFDSNYVPKSKVTSSVTDSIARLGNGGVYGPYIDRGSYVLAKMLGSKTMPDSVKARHILIATNDPQSGQPIMADSIAEKRADSILAAIKGGANFAALAAQYGTDATKDKGGDLGTFGYGSMVAEFNEVCFSKPVGTKQVVHTQFGWHVLEIVSTKGNSPAYKIAFVAKEILPSEATINKSSLDATKLSAEKNAKAFDAYVAKNGLQKTPTSSLIKENDATIGSLQDARQLVQWTFKTDKGIVSDPFSIDNQYVVAVVDNIYKEGTQDAKMARPMAEAAIRDQKRGDEIIKKLGANPTLETAAAAYSKQVQIAGADSSITFNSKIITNIGPEAKLIGAAFNKAYQTKVSPAIQGKTGVYLIKVNSIGNKAAFNETTIAMHKTQALEELRKQATANGAWFEGLKKKVTIKDNRSDFY